MTQQNINLWKKIQEAPLIGTTEDGLFTRKLATQNGWDLNLSRRVITEYRRFLLLAMEAGHPVSPSDAVDQAWHLHLTYTDAYWNAFCREVLARPFHHHPSKGGDHETAKFDEWYVSTLGSYERFFGERPPADIWPDPSLKREQDGRVHQRVDLAENWIVRKPALLSGRFNLARLAAIGIAALALLATGCATLGKLPPWDMMGPDFLFFYLALWAISWSVAGWLRWKLRVPEPEGRVDCPELQTYEAAYLGGGTRRVTQALMARLMGDGALVYDTKKKYFETGGPLKEPVDPLERVIHGRLSTRLSSGGEKLSDLQAGIESLMPQVENKLRDLGLLVSVDKMAAPRFIPLLVAAIPLAVGGLKLYYGITRDKPVEILTVLLIVTFVIWLIAFTRKAFRSRKGDAVLASLREQNPDIKSAITGEAALGTGTAVLPLAIALFGVNVLADTPFSYLRSKLGPEASSSGCGTGCGSSCGGGGDGGCGGGGCGGCGGGD
jgi:uncharacterized protein (TIGR04222 family)